VTSTDGTGLVHTAPPFGEDDYQTGRRYELPMILSVDGEGKIVPGAGAFAGMWFKDADAKIIQDLKSRGLMLHSDRYKHNYPFCWRCDRPLLYYATESWFVQTTAERASWFRRTARSTGTPSTSARGGSATGWRTSSTGPCRGSAIGGPRCRSGSAPPAGTRR